MNDEVKTSGLDNKQTKPIRGHTLSASLAKNTAPLPTPRVPFFFFPFLSISETAQVLMASALTLAAVERTSSAGSTYVVAGGVGRGGESGMTIWVAAEGAVPGVPASLTT